MHLTFNNWLIAVTMNLVQAGTSCSRNGILRMKLSNMHLRAWLSDEMQTPIKNTKDDEDITFITILHFVTQQVFYLHQRNIPQMKGNLLAITFYVKKIKNSKVLALWLLLCILLSWRDFFSKLKNIEKIIYYSLVYNSGIFWPT